MPTTEQSNKVSRINSASVLITLFLTLSSWVAPPSEASSSVYHATSTAFARRIMTKGFNPARFRSQARFGKKIYLASRPSTAIAERGSRSKLIRMETSKYLKNNSWDLRHPAPKNLRPYVGKTDFRGTIKKGIVGPKLGHRIGGLADQKGKAIQYRSVKSGGTNIAVPASLLSKHPRALYGKTIYGK